MRTNLSTLSASVYNGLPLLERVNAFVRGHGLVERMLEQVGPIFLHHHMQSDWGIYLVHHHWDIAPGEAPCEDRLPQDNAESYEMRPLPVGRALGYVPVTFGIMNGEFQGLEFSSVPSALRAYSKLVQKPRFVAELKRALIEHDLAPHFGLGAIKPLGPKMEWVETTGGERRSVTTALPVDTHHEIEVIQTAWHFAYGPRRTCTWKCGTNCLSEAEGAHAGSLS